MKIQSQNDWLMINELGYINELRSPTEESLLSRDFGCNGLVFNIHTAWNDYDHLYWAAYCPKCDKFMTDRESYKSLYFNSSNPFYSIAHIISNSLIGNCVHRPDEMNIARYLQERCSIIFDGKFKSDRRLPTAPTEFYSNSRQYSANTI